MHSAHSADPGMKIADSMVRAASYAQMASVLSKQPRQAAGEPHLEHEQLQGPEAQG